MDYRITLSIQFKCALIGIVFMCLNGCSKKVSDVYIEDFSAIGNGIHDDTYALQKAINTTNKYVHLEPKTYLITKEITLKSGVSILGNGATIKMDQSSNFNAIILHNVSNVALEKLTIVGQKNVLINSKSTGRERNLVSCKNSKNIRIENSVFRDHDFTTTHFMDVLNVIIRECAFTNIGGLTSSKEFPYYSYDAIFIGGYNMSKDILIKDCQFKDIGVSSKITSVPNDGDAIQLQSAPHGSIEEVTVKNSVFTNCSARAIKLQTGNGIVVHNNRFTKCSKGVGMTMVHDLNDIEITNNTFNDIGYVVSTNHKKEASDVLISENKVNKCNFFYRGSGGSFLTHSTIASNIINDIGYCFIDAKVKNLLVENNSVTGYASKGDKSYHMAILLGGESKNIKILDNRIKAVKETRTAIYLQTKISNVEIERNEFQVLENDNTDRIIVDHSNVVRRNTSNIIFRTNSKNLQPK